MWFWYEVLSRFMNPDSGVTWVLSIILLTFTIKGILVWPTVKQLQSSRKMAKLAPQLQEVRERYKNDQTKMAEESQKVYKDAKVNPLMGCLPMLIQIPVFIGLFHVLRSFNRTGEAGGFGGGGLGMSIEENRNTANYIFSPEHVQSFLDARFFGVPLSASMSMGQDQLEAFSVGGLDFSRWQVVAVAVPMVAFVAIVTHLNARYSLARQKSRKAAGKVSAPTGDNADMMQMQQDMMGKMMLWMMPAFTIFTGWIWTIGLLVYMSSNVGWSLIQMLLVYRKMDAEEAKEDAEKEELAKANAPQVGSRKVDRRTKAERREAAASTPQQASPKRQSAREEFEQRVNELPAIEPKDRDFVYLSNNERKALGQAKRAEYDKARDAFESRNPEVAAAAADAGAAGVGRQWVLDKVKDRYNT